MQQKTEGDAILIAIVILVAFCVFVMPFMMSTMGPH